MVGHTCAPWAAGVWLYSRKPVDPESTATMRGVAESLNLDISNLKPVTQVGRAHPRCMHTWTWQCRSKPCTSGASSNAIHSVSGLTRTPHVKGSE